MSDTIGNSGFGVITWDPADPTADVVANPPGTPSDGHSYEVLTNEEFFPGLPVADQPMRVGSGGNTIEFDSPADDQRFIGIVETGDVMTWFGTTQTITITGYRHRDLAGGALRYRVRSGVEHKAGGDKRLEDRGGWIPRQ